VNAGRLINMVLRMLMRSSRSARRRPGKPGGNDWRRKARMAFRMSRFFRR